MSGKYRITEYRKFLDRLKRKKSGQIDKLAASVHVDVFSSCDCTECAVCCSSLGPRLTRPDIERIAKAIGSTASSVIDSYLRIDEDGDYVYRELPCPFLAPDKLCSIYDDRPKACREYPHTDRNFHKRLTLTSRNLDTCPAVRMILERLMESLN